MISACDFMFQDNKINVFEMKNRQHQLKEQMHTLKSNTHVVNGQLSVQINI